MNVNEMRKLFVYTEWANELTLDAAEKLSAEDVRRDVRISHGSILGTLGHMAGAEWLWLERWHGHSPTGQNVWASWTAEACGNLQELRRRWQPIARRRTELLSRLTDQELSSELPFKRLTGEEYSLPLVDQMQHVVNHSTLHRGQVVGMIRQLGVTPPATDLLFYLIQRKSS
jgi:uncharacterized damage-inducible protein DinB